MRRREPRPPEDAHRPVAGSAEIGVGEDRHLSAWGHDMPTQHQLERYPDYLQAIGMIAIETVALEIQLASLLSRVLMVRRTVAEAIFLTPKAETARLDILENVARSAFATRPRADPKSNLEQQKAAALKKVLSIVQRSRTAINKRHRTMHDEWDVRGNPNVIRRLVVDGKPIRTSVPVKTDELSRQLAELRTLIDDVVDLTNELDHTKPLMVSLRLS
jgi:hypothetical protein